MTCDEKSRLEALLLAKDLAKYIDIELQIIILLYQYSKILFYFIFIIIILEHILRHTGQRVDSNVSSLLLCVRKGHVGLL